MQDVLKFVSPQILKQLIVFSQRSEAEAAAGGAWQGYFWALCLFVINLVQATVLQQYWKRAYLTGQGRNYDRTANSLHGLLFYLNSKELGQ